MTIQDIFVSKGSSYICVTVYYHVMHQPMVAKTTEQHIPYNMAQNEKKISYFVPVRVCILNMRDALEFSFALLIPLRGCRARLR